MKKLVLYFTLAYSISWIIWSPLYWPALGLPALWRPLPFNHALGALGPLLAALILTAFYKGRQGVKVLAQQMVKMFPLRFVVLALLLPFVLLLAAKLLSAAFHGQTFYLDSLGRSDEFPPLDAGGFFLYNLFFFGFGEEVGWRGYALPRLQARFGALVSSLVLALLWACWHWPLFLYRPGYTGLDAVGLGGWLFSLLTGSVLLTWMYNASRASILACAVFHATIDIAFTSLAGDQLSTNYLGMLITLVGIVAAWRWAHQSCMTCDD